jgi:hypothetical protein
MAVVMGWHRSIPAGRARTCGSILLRDQSADLGLGLDLVYVAAKIVRDRLERSALLDELLEFVQIER